MAGSIGAVIASTAPIAIGIGATNAANPVGIIGISEVQNIGIKAIEESGKGIL